MKITNFIANVFRNIERNLVIKSNEPQVEQKRDRDGNIYWRVYDFTTNKSHIFGSDRDVKIWIENRYHSF